MNRFQQPYYNNSYPSNGRSQEEIEKRFNEAEDERKLFVGGLSWATKDEDLLRYFAHYGAVEEAAMKRDRNGNPRGFAFIIYHEPAAVDKVMQQSTAHILNGRKIDPKRARAQSSHGAARPRKMFVRNSKACTEDELKDYFSQYGTIANIDLPVYTNDDGSFSRREYCFIEFEDEEAVNNACNAGTHTIGSTMVETRKFDTKQSGAAVAKGGPPDLVRAKKQRFAPYGTHNPGFGMGNSSANSGSYMGGGGGFMAPTHASQHMMNGTAGFYHSSGGMHPNQIRAPHSTPTPTHATPSGSFAGPRFSNDYYSFNNYAAMPTHEGSGNQGPIKPEAMGSNEYFVPMAGGAAAGAQNGHYSASPSTMFATPPSHLSYSGSSSPGFYPTATPNRHAPQNFYANVQRAAFKPETSFKQEPNWGKPEPNW